MNYPQLKKQIDALIVSETSAMENEHMLNFQNVHAAESILRIQQADAGEEIVRAGSWIDAITDAVSLGRTVGLEHYLEELERQAAWAAMESIRLGAFARGVRNAQKKGGTK